MSKKQGIVIAIIIVLITIFCCGVCGLTIWLFSATTGVKLVPPTNLSCTYNGHTYNDGEGFPSADGCNSCGCTNGMIACTLRACIN